MTVSDASQPQRVLIVGYSDWEGLSRSPWLFHRAGWLVEVFTRPGNFLAQVSHLSALHTSKGPLTRFADALQTFLAIRPGRYARVVIGDDPLLWELARRRTEPWARALLPCDPNDAAIDFLTSKIAFIRGCQDASLPVPDSQVCTTREQVIAVAARLGAPVVIKQKEGFSGHGVSVITTLEELHTLPLGEQVIVQAFVRGPVCSAAALYSAGRLEGFYAYRRARTWGPLGASAAIRFHVFPELESVLQRLGRLSGFTGLCGIDFIEQADSGRVLLLEQNFRPTLTMLLGNRVGVDFSELLRGAAHQNPHIGPPRRQDPGVVAEIPLFPTDVLRAISENDLPGLLRWCWHPSWWRELNWHDRKLLAHNLRFIGRAAARKLIGALRRI